MDKFDTEWAKLILTLVTAVVTAIWTFMKWRGQREKELQSQEEERKRQRRRWAALYVNPFLIACQELQSRMYNLMAQNALPRLRDRHPDGSYAEEILYLIAQYFAWERCIYRYSPYAQDETVILLTEKIRDALASSAPGIGPFCFFRTEQRGLGQMVLERHAGEFGPEFDTIPLQEFRQRLQEPVYAEQSSIAETLNALRNAKSIKDFDATISRRLATLQSLLVELLAYMENREGITLFASDLYSERQRLDPQKF